MTFEGWIYFLIIGWLLGNFQILAANLPQRSCLFVSFLRVGGLLVCMKVSGSSILFGLFANEFLWATKKHIFDFMIGFRFLAELVDFILQIICLSHNIELHWNWFRYLLRSNGGFLGCEQVYLIQFIYHIKRLIFMI